MKKILILMGTRPEVIKLAPIIHQIRRNNQIFDLKVCSTGQHLEMLYQAIEQFEISLDYDLKLMKKNQSLFELSSQLLITLPEVLKNFNPDMVLVQGDTTSAFIAGLICFYQKIKVGHVEAGLRTYDKFAPFPEEINRRLLSVVADYHFAPTEKAKEFLLKEGIELSKILVTGNTVVDALHFILKKIKINPPDLGILDQIIAGSDKVILITGHRRESFGEGFQNICEAIRTLALKYPQIAFIYPVHLNPNVQKPVYHILSRLSNVHLVKPLGYIPFIKLLSAAHIILTDSGGIQEEAPSLGKPVIVMRELTERLEAVESGKAFLVGTNKNKIIDEVSKLVIDYEKWKTQSSLSNPFGDGKAAERITDFLINLNLN